MLKSTTHRWLGLCMADKWIDRGRLAKGVTTYHVSSIAVIVCYATFLCWIRCIFISCFQGNPIPRLITHSPLLSPNTISCIVWLSASRPTESPQCGLSHLCAYVVRWGESCKQTGWTLEASEIVNGAGKTTKQERRPFFHSIFHRIPPWLSSQNVSFRTSGSFSLFQSLSVC